MTGTPGGTWTKLHEQPAKLTVRIWCLYIWMKIIHSSFVKGTLPRLVGLKLALQLCFALQARACLFHSWKQLGVEIHKKPVLCEMQEEYMIFQDSPPSFLFAFFFFFIFFLASSISSWWPSFLSEDQTCLQSLLMLHLPRGRAPECWGPVFSHQSNIPATEQKLHSLLRTCSVLISSLDPCIFLIWQGHTNIFQLNTQTDAEMGTCD